MHISFKLTTPTLIGKICEEAKLPLSANLAPQKLTRKQLIELYVYITELKNLNIKLQQQLSSIQKDQHA